MTVDAPEPPPRLGLRERLVARGAKPHRRMSDLSRYMLDRKEELQTLINVDGFSWADIAALLAEDEGLTDDTGKPVTALSARLAWSRLRRRQKKAAPQVGAQLITERLPGAQDDPVRVSTHTAELPFSTCAERTPVIRAARPRDAPTPTAAKPLISASVPPKDDEALRQELDDLARRQSTKKIAPPDVL